MGKRPTKTVLIPKETSLCSCDYSNEDNIVCFAGDDPGICFMCGKHPWWHDLDNNANQL